MKRIGVLSDTHGVVPKQVYTFFKDCDELWHAGDMGRGVYEELSRFKPLRAVYGNMDDYDLRYRVSGSKCCSPILAAGQAIIRQPYSRYCSTTSPTSLSADTAISSK